MASHYRDAAKCLKAVDGGRTTLKTAAYKTQNPPRTVALVSEVRRHRKAFGGAMRQAGVIAAGALYALEHHVDRLAEDHTHAGILADAVEVAEGLELHSRPDTNIVFFDVDSALGEAADFVAALQREGVYMLALGPGMVRAVTHLDVSAEQIRRAAEVIPRVAQECASGLRTEAVKTSTY